MGNFKKNQAISKLRTIEAELEQTMRDLKSKGSALRALSNRPRAKIYYVTESHYRKKIEKMYEICDRLNLQLSQVEEEHAKAQKFEQIGTETDPDTGFTKSSMRPEKKGTRFSKSSVRSEKK